MQLRIADLLPQAELIRIRKEIDSLLSRMEGEPRVGARSW